MSSEETLHSPLETGTGTEEQVEAGEFSTDPSESGEIGHLIERMETMPPVAQGEVVRGTVVKVTDAEVIVDLGLKSEGAIAREEFLAADGSLTIGAGDAVDVWVDDYDEQEGTVSVSYRKAARRRAWEDIEKAFQEQTALRGRAVERVKGGLVIDIGLRAFLPGSQADLRPHFSVDTLLGQEISCRIIKLNRKRNNVVVSRRVVLEEELSRRQRTLLEGLTEGAVLEGRVKNMTPYGVFVDLGGIDGLLHITDLSWGRVAHPSEVVRAGQQLKVMVLKFDRERERVSLGLKQLMPNPWEEAASKFHVGDRATGRVVGIVDYGAFVELEPGVEGLIHISEMSWSKRLKHPSKILNPGDQVEVAVLDVNPSQRRISLSLKQTLSDPWSTLAERYKVGSVVEGRVRNLTEFGAFIEVEEGVDGLVHLSNLSWTDSVKHPSEVLRKGQKVEAAILNIDTEHRRLALGLKQLQPDVWGNFFSNKQVGEVLRGKVTRVATFGAFVELEPGIEGLCHTSEMDENHKGSGPERLEAGKEYNFRVIRLNPAEKKIGLSMKDVEQPESRAVAPEAAQAAEVREEVEGSSAAAEASLSPPPLEAAESSPPGGEVESQS
jgi:small subunit ribosomal protein S1